jgi:hypothetical protein
MPEKSIIAAHKASKAKRVLNEFDTKIINEEKLDKVVESRETSHQSSHSVMSFKCECDNKACPETIQMSTEEYQQVHRTTKSFVVVPRHVRLDLEEIVIAFSDYVIVAKLFPS